MKKNLNLKGKDGSQKVLDKSKKIKKSPILNDKKKFGKAAIKSASGLEEGVISTANGGAGKVMLKGKNEKKKYKTGNVGSIDASGNAAIGTPNDSPGKQTVTPKNQPKQKTGQIKIKDSSVKAPAKWEKKNVLNVGKKLKTNELKTINNSKNPNEGKNPSSKPKKNKKLMIIGGSKEPSKRHPIKNAETVFVGNLPINTKRVQLLRLFNNYGPVNGIRFRTASGQLISKHKMRKEAGSLIAWVVLKDKETATRALDLNGTLFKNNHLRVTSANNLNNIGVDTNRTIFVGNLKYSANEEKLREIFSSCGDIDYIRCLHDDKGCKGVAYVCFKTPDAVGLALELNETMLDERPINVERYSVKKLGAKKKRDSANVEPMKTSPTGKKLKDKKQGKQLDNGNSNKKSKFRGVKIEAIKKKQKKTTSQMQKLAKKIAPMPKL